MKLSFGVKTGEYDSHIENKTGGTKITLSGDEFTVEYVFIKER